MNRDFIHDDWKIISVILDPDSHQVLESITSLGNGRLGCRGNLEEGFEGSSLSGSYIAGVYYPDKTKVGWWKNGYPEYFAKVINSVNWIGISVHIDGNPFVISPSKVLNFRTELDMKEGILRRTATVQIDESRKVLIETERFYSMVNKDRALLQYSLSPLDFSGEISLNPYLDFDVHNQDSNYNESFWDQLDHGISDEGAFVYAKTKKTAFHVFAGMKTLFLLDDKVIQPNLKFNDKPAFVEYVGSQKLNQGQKITLQKHVCICTDLFYEQKDLKEVCFSQLADSLACTYESERQSHIEGWDKIWRDCDISISGDVAAQQGIRFNIFQLYQTYTGEDPRFNIGPKGFTGEKYGGVTYWDTEAYCIPFYLSTANQEVAENLLKYRYNHLPKAIENATKLGFSNGAALYPMVTMNGEECHNEWEITFEEIHRNAAIAYAIFNYIRYTGNKDYLSKYGLEVLIAIARFWYQRTNWSEDKQQYVILGVTGPNEYENNVNNNWYTNYAAKWCLSYCLESIKWVKENDPPGFDRIIDCTNFDLASEPAKWTEVMDNMYSPYDKKRDVFLQQDGFLDKEIIPATKIPKGEYPIHEHWSWDRILRSCFIKQADVLQGLFFFEDQFDKETIRRNFNFYEPLTVHESSLSPCIHAILASKIGREDKAYEMYLRTARLDLDDYNNDTKDGLHITSMAGTWMAFVMGFGGMRVIDDKLSFTPFIPKNWEQYSFKINFRGTSIKLVVSHHDIQVINLSSTNIEILLNGELKAVQPHLVNSFT